MFKQRKLLVFWAVSALVIAGLACNLPGISDTNNIPTSPAATEDLQAMETQVSAAIATGRSGGKITLELTEGQLSAAANKALQESGEDRVQNVGISLADGVMTVTGNATQNGLTLPVNIALRIAVDGDGRPHTQIINGKLGPFPLPDNLLAQVTNQFDQALQAELDANGGNLFVESLIIANGKITVVAQAR